MDTGAQAYIDGIAPEFRPLFDRLHHLILEVCPGADVVLSYGIPTYRVGNSRLHVGAWKHGLSIYGSSGRDGGFTSRHPELRTSKGTLRLSPAAAADIPDQELRSLVHAALGP